METLPNRLGSEIMEGASPWPTEDGDPVALLHASRAAEVKICFSSRATPGHSAFRCVGPSWTRDETLTCAWQTNTPMSGPISNLQLVLRLVTLAGIVSLIQ
jgi:hypothetical protein